jgi:hypothetical protein
MTEEIALKVWGEGFGLPSIDAESIAAIAYCVQVSKSKPLEWVAESGYDTSSSPSGSYVFSD